MKLLQIVLMVDLFIEIKRGMVPNGQGHIKNDMIINKC